MCNGTSIKDWKTVKSSETKDRFFFIIKVWPDPGCFLGQIRTKRRGIENYWPTFFVAINLQNLNYFTSEKVPQKKIWANWQRISLIFTQKIVTMLSEIWVLKARSGIRNRLIPDPGVKRASDPESGTATLLKSNLASQLCKCYTVIIMHSLHGLSYKFLRTANTKLYLGR